MEGEQENEHADTAVHRSSLAFSIMCMFLTLLYAGFAAVMFVFSKALLEENAIDEQQETLASTRSHKPTFVGGYDGYIGERFDVRPANGGGTPGFVAPTITEGTLA